MSESLPHESKPEILTGKITLEKLKAVPQPFVDIAPAIENTCATFVQLHLPEIEHIAFDDNKTSFHLSSLGASASMVSEISLVDPYSDSNFEIPKPMFFTSTREFTETDPKKVSTLGLRIHPQYLEMIAKSLQDTLGISFKLLTFPPTTYEAVDGTLVYFDPYESINLLVKNEDINTAIQAIKDAVDLHVITTVRPGSVAGSLPIKVSEEDPYIFIHSGRTSDFIKNLLQVWMLYDANGQTKTDWTHSLIHTDLETCLHNFNVNTHNVAFIG